MIKALAKATIVYMLQYISVSSQHIVSFKLTQYYVSFISDLWRKLGTASVLGSFPDLLLFPPKNSSYQPSLFFFPPSASSFASRVSLPGIMAELRLHGKNTRLGVKQTGSRHHLCHSPAVWTCSGDMTLLSVYIWVLQEADTRQLDMREAYWGEHLWRLKERAGVSRESPRCRCDIYERVWEGRGLHLGSKKA